MKPSEIKTQSARSLAEIFQNWQSEDRELERKIDEVRKWMYEVSQFGDPHFGEAATRLGPLRKSLVEHFAREDEMTSEIAASHLTSTRRANTMSRQSAGDRAELFASLDDLRYRLNQLEPPFSSWQRAMDEVDAFVHSLEQHEARESQSMAALIPESELG